ncbi:MAG: aminotransferase class V-fold PLP-dependent enzyme [Mangrovibacterium sp.]
MTINIQHIRKDFPVLNQEVYKKPFIYFDSAASAQKPIVVLKKEEQLHLEYYGNIHRGAHFMADKATEDFEHTRALVKDFIGAESTQEVIFTKGTTESINLVAFSFGEAFIKPGDEILISEMEHHANIVPWQMMAQRKGAIIKVLPFADNGELKLEMLDELLSEKTKMVCVAWVANTLGTINPVKEIAAKAHAVGAKILVDAAQAASHVAIDVQDIDADFLAFSAHKIYGPNGVGVLYGKKELLDAMPPYQGGGEMISEVSFEKTTYNELPHKFEAGTPNIIGVIAFGEALKYFCSFNIEDLAAHEHELLTYATAQLKQIEGMQIYGESAQKSSVITFNVEGVHSFDLSTMLDKMGVAVRAGRLCADTVMRHFNIPSTVRISFAIYNTKAEIDAFIGILNKLLNMLR